MSNGSMQFLGRQLSEQAKQLSLLVDKMIENTYLLSQSVPKFAEPSTNIKSIIPVNFTGSNVYNVNNNKTFTCYMGGKIRIYTKGKSVSLYETSGYKLIIYKNGVLTATGPDLISSTETTRFVDVFVLENDLIDIRFDYVGTESAQVNVVDYSIAYDMVIKPNISL